MVHFFQKTRQTSIGLVSNCRNVFWSLLYPYWGILKMKLKRACFSTCLVICQFWGLLSSWHFGKSISNLIGKTFACMYQSGPVGANVILVKWHIYKTWTCFQTSFKYILIIFKHIELIWLIIAWLAWIHPINCWQHQVIIYRETLLYTHMLLIIAFRSMLNIFSKIYFFCVFVFFRTAKQ